MSKEPANGNFTARETFHMSSGFPVKGETQEHRTSYAILLNGEDTGIVRSRLTHGSPDYAVQFDVLIAPNGDELDLRTHTTAEVHEWCAAHLSQPSIPDAGPHADPVQDETLPNRQTEER